MTPACSGIMCEVRIKLVYDLPDGTVVRMTLEHRFVSSTTRDAPRVETIFSSCWTMRIRSTSSLFAQTIHLSELLTLIRRLTPIDLIHHERTILRHCAPEWEPMFVLPLLRENEAPGCPIQRALENAFVV